MSTVTSTTLGAQLEALDAKVSECETDWADARAAETSDRQVRVREAVNELTGALDDVSFRRRSPLDPGEHAKLTARLLERISDLGLVIRPQAQGAPGYPNLLDLHDPQPEARVRSAEIALRKARHDRDVFRTENATDLAADQQAADAESLRSALDAGDVEALRKVLA